VIFSKWMAIGRSVLLRGVRDSDDNVLEPEMMPVASAKSLIAEYMSV